MSFAELEPGIVLQVLLHLDSRTAFRTRRCNRAFANLFADGDLHLCRGLLEGTSFCPGSHTAKSGIWLHAVVPKDVTHLYFRYCSAMRLATDLQFKDMTVVAGLLKASCMLNGIAAGEDVVDNGQLPQTTQVGYVTRHGRPICLKGPLLGSLLHIHMGRGQRFLGSWTFNTKRVRAMLFGNELGLVCSSYVEFHAMLSCCNGFEGELGVRSQRKLQFGVQLILSRTAFGRFVLSWQPCITAADLPDVHIGCFCIHLHGHAAAPFTFPLGYEGAILASSDAQLHIKGDVPVELTLSIDDTMQLLEHHCLNCALNVQLHHEFPMCPGMNSMMVRKEIPVTVPR